MKKQITNKLQLTLFCVLMGGFAGLVIWVFLKIMSLGIAFLWEWLPEKFEFPLYTLIICTAGGAIIGLIRKKFGDYPEELHIVMAKVKKEKHYEYKNMLVLLISALIPLLIGASVGPEAGLAGIIVALCYWIGDNLKFAQKNTDKYTQMGMAVTLSVLFHSPLFGIFAVEENDDYDTDDIQISKSSKIFIYGIAIVSATGIYMLLSEIFGAGMAGFPSFEFSKPALHDFLMMIVYIIAGCILAMFYELTHKACRFVAEKIPAILKETTAGLLLGIIATFVPAVMFSGEEQMAELMTDYSKYLPCLLIAVAFLKVLVTNMCIQSGLKGGHFFPVIFAGACLGYGIAMLVFANSASNVVFAAAIVTATMLGGVMKKPLAVTVLLLICFPIKMSIWIFLSALIGSKLFSIAKKDKQTSKQNK